MNDIAVARAVHVMAIIIWIGGVSMVTMAALPAARANALGADMLRAFHAFEHRFTWQARGAILIAGLSGLYMVAQLRLWDRFASLHFRWMHAMIGIWLLFASVPFVVEPFFLYVYFERFAQVNPDRAFAWIHRGAWA